MVNIAVLEYSADANSWIRQVKCFFPAHFSPSDDNKKGCSLDQPPSGPQGGLKVTPRPYTEKNFVFERGIQMTQNDLICLDPLLWKTLFWTKKKTEIFHSGWFWCKNGEYCRFGIFCWCWFRNETSKMFFPAHSSPSDDNKKGSSSDQPPWGPPGGPKEVGQKSTPSKSILQVKMD